MIKILYQYKANNASNKLFQVTDDIRVDDGSKYGKTYYTRYEAQLAARYYMEHCEHVWLDDDTKDYILQLK